GGGGSTASSSARGAKVTRLWRGSSTPTRFAYWCRRPPLASAVEPEQTVSRSRTITRSTRSRARWYAVLTPMMPAPMMTTSAVSVIDASMSLRPVAIQGQADGRVPLGGEIGGQRDLHDLARPLGRAQDGPAEGHTRGERAGP